MDQMERKPGNPDLMDKPFVGFVVILLVALFVGGWLYVDSVRGEMEMRIDAVSSQVETLKAELHAKTAAQAPVATEAAWRTFTAYDAFSVDLPAGYRFQDTGDGGYVVADPPKSDAELPYAQITVVGKTPNLDLGGKTILGKNGIYYCLRLWEDLAWEPFDTVAATFKSL